MFCSNCGNQLVAGASFCASCGNPVPTSQAAAQASPASYQQPVYAPSASAKSRVTAGVLGILLGWLGIHKFYMGKIGAGVIYLVLTLTFFLSWIPAIVGLVEGIIYLAEDDKAFNAKVNDGKFF